MEIKSKEIRLVRIDRIVEHPSNANRHTLEQIERLAEIIQDSGFREPLVVSTLSGKLVAGHCRLAAAKLIGMTELPVIHQSFSTESGEIKFMIADNEIARWAELDRQLVYKMIEELEIPNIEMLGIEKLKPIELEVVLDAEPTPKKEKNCPHCGELI